VVQGCAVSMPTADIENKKPAFSGETRAQRSAVCNGSKASRRRRELGLDLK